MFFYTKKNPTKTRLALFYLVFVSPKRFLDPPNMEEFVIFDSLYFYPFSSHERKLDKYLEDEKRELALK